MTLDELIARLNEIRAEDTTRGNWQVLDTNAYPIINAVVSEDDEASVPPLNRVYIESEF
jgi:hypothetical protein